MTRHLIDTRKRLVKCATCNRTIWFAYDGGMPVYAETDNADPTSEIRARLTGANTFVETGPYLALRNTHNIGSGDVVHLAHPHRNGITEIERPAECPTTTNKKATDSSAPY